MAVDEMLVSVSNYIILFLFWALSIMLIFLVSALILCSFFRKKGWINITERGPRWFQLVFLTGALFTGSIIGMVIGIQVGSSKTGLQIADDVGKTMIDSGLERAVQPFGLENLQQPIDLEMARQVLDNIRDVQLAEPSGVKAKIINKSFENIRCVFQFKKNY